MVKATDSFDKNLPALDESLSFKNGEGLFFRRQIGLIKIRADNNDKDKVTTNEKNKR